MSNCTPQAKFLATPLEGAVSIVYGNIVNEVLKWGSKNKILAKMCSICWELIYLSPMTAFLNRRDLETFLPGLEVFLKLQILQISPREKLQLLN